MWHQIDIILTFLFSLSVYKYIKNQYIIYKNISTKGYYKYIISIATALSNGQLRREPVISGTSENKIFSEIL